jgi:hypothetical protein
MTIKRAGRPDLLLLHLRNSVLPKALNLFHGTSGARSEDCPCSCAFLLIHLRPNATVCFYFCFGRKLRWFCVKKTIKKILFFNRTVKLRKCSGNIAATLYKVSVCSRLLSKKSHFQRNFKVFKGFFWNDVCLSNKGNNN